MKEELFIKKEWKEEQILFYLHFVNGWAVRQIEVHPNKVIKLSEEHTTEGESFLCDQKMSDLVIEEYDFITKEEFESAWNKYDQ